MYYIGQKKMFSNMIQNMTGVSYCSVFHFRVVTLQYDGRVMLRLQMAFWVSDL